MKGHWQLFLPIPHWRVTGNCFFHSPLSQPPREHIGCGPSYSTFLFNWVEAVFEAPRICWGLFLAAVQILQGRLKICSCLLSVATPATQKTNFIHEEKVYYDLTRVSMVLALVSSNITSCPPDRYSILLCHYHCVYSYCKPGGGRSPRKVLDKRGKWGWGEETSCIQIHLGSQTPCATADNMVQSLYFSSLRKKTLVAWLTHDICRHWQ